MMKILIFSVIFVITEVYPASITETETAKTCKKYEEFKLNTDAIDRPYLLSYDKSKSTLYFSYSINSKDDTFSTAKLDIKTKNISDIDVPNGFAQNVDDKTNLVILGGNNGLYKYDSNTETVEEIGNYYADIWSVFAKDNIVYYSEYPSQLLYQYDIKNNTTVKLDELRDIKVDQFVIDDTDDIYFSHSQWIYRQKKGSNIRVRIGATASDEGVRCLTIDNEGDVYACAQNGVYVIKDEKLEKVLNIDDLFGLAFDENNNIIYSTATSLIHRKCVVDEITTTSNPVTTTSRPVVTTSSTIASTGETIKETESSLAISRYSTKS